MESILEGIYILHVYGVWDFRKDSKDTRDPPTRQDK